MTAKIYVPSSDKGCEFAPSCLECPFPECIEESKGGKWGWRKKKRNIEIKRLSQQGKTVKELMALFNLGERQIERIVQK